MKKIEAVIQPHMLEKVQIALNKAGVLGMMVSEVRGHGKQMGYTEQYRGVRYTVNLLPKVKLEIVVADAQVEGVVEAILQSARSGAIGDGKIFVSDLREAIRIRTGERGETAV